MEEKLSGTSPAEQRKTIPASRLLEEPFRSLVETAVSEVAKEKHDKVASVDFNKLLKPICNILVETLENKVFGYFEKVHQEAFSSEYGGVFRNLRGASEPFLELFEYSGARSFSKNQLFLVDLNSKQALELTPLYVWGLNSLMGANNPADLYMFDSVRGDGFVYNSVQDRDEIVIHKDGKIDVLWNMVRAQREQDEPLQLIDCISLERRG